jgi:hypothetical protein
MKKLLLTILLNVLLLLPVVGWGGVHGFIRYGKWRSGAAVGLEPIPERRAHFDETPLVLQSEIRESEGKRENYTPKYHVKYEPR